MEVAQDNAQEIVIIGTHAVDHAVKNGMNLHVLFLSDIQFIDRTDGLVENRIEKNDFLEYANYVGNYYGTPKSYVVEQLKQGKDVLLEIEIQGAMQVKKLMPEALTIFVMPPSADTLKDRLVGRGTEKKEVIEARLGRAVEESQGIENYDYILVNDDLEESTKRLNELISLAHDASFRNYNFINKIREELKVFRKEI